MKYLFLAILISSFSLFIQLFYGNETVWADALEVSAAYSKIEGNEVIIELHIGKPAPKTILLTQTLPAGINIIKASPNYSKYDKETGKATWLLKDIKPGKKEIHFMTDRPITGQISGSLGFRSPKTGKMIRLTITP